MRTGIDVDGVLADFNTSFIERVVDVTGKDLFPARPFIIPTWNYPEHYGYTSAEVSTAWSSVLRDGGFWMSLRAYPETPGVMETLGYRIREGEDVYFITARSGVNAKLQTERWLRSMFPWLLCPTVTVLITRHKGLAARTLDLDCYLDDRWENAIDVSTTSTRSYLLTRPWNVHADSSDVVRVDSVAGFLAGSAMSGIPSAVPAFVPNDCFKQVA